MATLLERSTITTHTVSTRRQRETFVRFPWQIYDRDPHWVPPLLIERREFIDPRKHPFYCHGQARQWLAYDEGRLVGRIQASVDPQYDAEHGTRLGCFGMFECTNDPRVASELLDAAARWLSDHGVIQMRGPIDYSTNYNCGLLIDGFQTPPRVMMNHNPPYYQQLLEDWGLTKAKDLYAWWFDDSLDVAEKWSRKAERLGRRGRVQIRCLNLKDMDAELDRIRSVYNAAWERNWGFVKMTDAELQHFAKVLSHIALPELLLFAEVDGRPVGLSLTLPDVNEALRPLDGRLFRWGLPIGYFQFRAGLKRIKSCRLMALGIVNGFRRRGVAELLILRTLEYGKNTAGYIGGELSWTLEDNQLITGTIEAVGGRRYKTYRIYEKPID